MWALGFKYPCHFMSRFLDRVNLSFRKTRPAKWLMIRNEAGGHFLAQLAAGQAEYPAECIINFDESN
jgi:hypothetical protein